jgi:AraC-like DNA-binding protein
MVHERFTLPVLYVRHIADQVRSLGADVAQWLAASGFSEEKLASPSLTITFEQFVTLVRGALVATREPALGLFVGERLVAGTHGILGYAALSSGTVRQALELLERFTRLRTSLVSVSTEVRAREVRVRFDETRPLDDLRSTVLEAIVLSIKNVLGTISFGACHVTEVSFSHPAPEYAAVAQDLFGCSVKFGRSWAGFTLPLDVMDVPLKMADPEAFREAALYCQRELEKLTADESMAGRVHRLLLEKQSGFPSLQVTARLFRTTPRTLHRRLVEEGTSYRELLEKVRHAIALEHVTANRSSMEEIAYMLGYSDLANFRRAFKRWESVSPSAYREAHVGANGRQGLPASPRKHRSTERPDRP